MRSSKYWISSLLLVLLFPTVGMSQYSWVYFSDKPETGDYFETPVDSFYTQKINDLGIPIVGSSRWLNAVCVASEHANALKSLPFVCHIEALNPQYVNTHSTQEEYAYGASDWQINMLRLNEYHQLGYTGRGVNVGVFDAGFFKVDSLAQFKTLRDSNRITAAYDFVANDSLTYRESTHGMQVLALLGALQPDSMVGASPNANFVLARTEEAGRERHLEEYNWLRAMEWADSVGVDIIHSSLGYSLFDSLEGDYTYADMDGESTIITLAAEQAYQRGIFITNSAGNSGNSPWFYITAPCDGEHVLCVGAVDSNQVITAFSSRGPSSDGRIKPDVVAMGGKNTVPAGNGLLRRGSGTSFSGPLIAGMIACLKQAHPGRNNDEIFAAVLQSSDRFNSPDSVYGYGLPNVLVADSILRLKASVAPTQSMQWQLYPNPSKDYLRIAAPPRSAYWINGQDGKEHLHGRLENWINFVSTTSLPPGVYYMRIATGNRTSVKRFIKI